MAKPAPSGTKRTSSARTKGPTPRGTSPKAAARTTAPKAKGPTPRGTSPKAAARTTAPKSGRTPPEQRRGRAGPERIKPTKDAQPSGKATKGDVDTKSAPDGTRAKVAAAPIASVTVSAGGAAGSGSRAAPKPSGRFTPKATKPVAPPPVSSGRYTPPIPRNKRSSPPWVPVLMLSLLILGALTIVLDYLGVLPYGTSAWYLLVGLVFVAAGFAVATQYR